MKPLILVTGGPKTGKTTMCAKLARELFLKHVCTDPQRLCPAGVIGTPDALSWSETSEHVARKLLGNPELLIEGVAVPRALKKWHTEDLPCDLLVVLTNPFGGARTAKQIEMEEQLEAVVHELTPRLKDVLWASDHYSAEQAIRRRFL